MATANLKLVRAEYPPTRGEPRRLPVLTVFYADNRGREAVKKIRSGSPLRAMQNCLGHMRRNTYTAVLAEVYNIDTGKLYGVMKRTVDDQVHPIFQLPLKKDE